MKFQFLSFTFQAEQPLQPASHFFLVLKKQYQARLRKGRPVVQIIMKCVKGKSRIHVITIGAMGTTQHMVIMYVRLMINEDVESTSCARAFPLDL